MTGNRALKELQIQNSFHRRNMLPWYAISHKHEKIIELRTQARTPLQVHLPVAIFAVTFCTARAYYMHLIHEVTFFACILYKFLTISESTTTVMH